MFKNWGFLIGEMIFLLLIAALLGLFVGWIIWGRRRTVNVNGDGDLRIDGLQTQLSAKEAELSRTQEQLAQCNAARSELEAQASGSGAAAAAAVAAAPVAAAVQATQGDAEGVDYDNDGVIEGKDEGTKPATLSAARGGQADDLKQIKGIGPKLEKLCNSLGFYHFDQIAAWTDQEVAWVDANLEGFKGRVSRDEWVSQAKILAEGGATEFSNRVKGGDVY